MRNCTNYRQETHYAKEKTSTTIHLESKKGHQKETQVACCGKHQNSMRYGPRHTPCVFLLRRRRGGGRSVARRTLAAIARRRVRAEREETKVTRTRMGKAARRGTCGESGRNMASQDRNMNKITRGNVKTGERGKTACVGCIECIHFPSAHTNTQTRTESESESENENESESARAISNANGIAFCRRMTRTTTRTTWRPRSRAPCDRFRRTCSTCCCTSVSSIRAYCERKCEIGYLT